MTQHVPTTKTETLYRKYRPQTFDDILGQSEVVDTLKKAIESGSIAHAYLFSGGRGTGKTSIARIFARELGIDEQDVYEIDAASHTGVDNVRELRDGVSTLPFASQYKIYIIDEAHMLSKQAFNALLKTLEEPPAHVIFILATTEKNKIPDTIISRCQVYNFKLAIQDSLVALIERVVKAEQRTIDTQSAQSIAKMGDGSFRDTLSHLQKIFALTDKEISVDTISLDIITNSLDIEILDAMSRGNKDVLYDLYKKYKEGGMSVTNLVDSLIEQTRTVLMLRYSREYQSGVQDVIASEQVERYSTMTGITSHTLRDLLETKALILKSASPEESFEVFLFEQVEKREEKE